MGFRTRRRSRLLHASLDTGTGYSENLPESEHRPRATAMGSGGLLVIAIVLFFVFALYRLIG